LECGVGGAHGLQLHNVELRLVFKRNSQRSNATHSFDQPASDRGHHVAVAPLPFYKLWAKPVALGLPGKPVTEQNRRKWTVFFLKVICTSQALWIRKIKFVELAQRGLAIFSLRQRLRNCGCATAEIKFASGGKALYFQKAGKSSFF
jgi:hypothetical protein